MDERYSDSPVGARSAEEAAWDEEFNNTRQRSGVGSTVGELARLTVQVPGAVMSMTANMFPQDTRRHARAAVREGFLAVRSLLGAIGDGIESALSDRDASTGSTRQPLTTSGPAGTWGTAPSAAGPVTTGGGRARRIELADLDPAPTSAAGGDEDDAPDERGLRAEIDY